MKIGIIGDIHFSEYSSILRSRGKKFSTRLENCIDSINWAEAYTQNCDQIIYLGDFFDKSILNAEELTALADIKWNDVPHKFLVGNHEMGINSLVFSSAHVFKNNGFDIIDSARTEVYNDFELCYLPYILEENREPLANYFKPYVSGTKIRYIFSHNDIAGIQMGKFVSKAGFSIEEIEADCNLFVNGHLHNGMPLTNKIINLGNLTGQNFSEDGFIYSHNIMTIDTDNKEYDVRRNPHAIYFYKLDSIKDIERVQNAVVTLKVKAEEAQDAKELLEKSSNIITSRLIVDHSVSEQRSAKDLTVNHLDEFSTFVLEQFKDSDELDLVKEELGYIYG